LFISKSILISNIVCLQLLFKLFFCKTYIFEIFLGFPYFFLSIYNIYCELDSHAIAVNCHSEDLKTFCNRSLFKNCKH